jgi:hypothetical protein
VPGKRDPLCEGLVQGALQLALEQPTAGSQLGRQGGGLDKKFPRRLR